MKKDIYFYPWILFPVVSFDRGKINAMLVANKKPNGDEEMSLLTHARCSL